jgi:LIVCS family branched-chain amino acid:cation transporter
MKKLFSSTTVVTGLAIFSMLFGAGNLMYPLTVGITSGDQTWLGMLGFFLSAVCLPVMGLIGMILFDGNYERFFGRLGHIPGSIMIFICMMIIGPMLAIPRITTLSHIMIAPFMPFLNEITPLNSFIFSLIFLGITFLATYRENKIVEILGNFISPALLVSLAIIIIKGIASAQSTTHVDTPPAQIFSDNLIRGYETLDLLGALFFAAIVLNILKNTLGQQISQNPRLLAWVGLKAGLLGVTCLGAVYMGMSILGAYHGHGLATANAGELFREISFRILGAHGAFIIATAVLMACLSTAIALSAVVAEYAQFTIFRNKVNFVTALIITLLACIPLSIGGLGQILKLTAGPLIYIGTPILIAITVCNILYKLFGFKYIKLPVAVTAILAALSYLK